MPERVLVKHPRAAAYLVLGMALVIFGLTVWLYLLSGRVSDAEAIRRVEKRGEAARAELGTRFANTLVQTSICIPLANINDLLDHGTLTPRERLDRIAARTRYLEKLSELMALSPSVKGCDDR